MVSPWRLGSAPPSRASRPGVGPSGPSSMPSPRRLAASTLEQIVAQLRRLFDLSGCAFLVVDWKQRYIRPPRRGSSDASRAFARCSAARTTRARRRHRGRGRVRRGGADPARQRVAGRRGPARPPVRAPRRPSCRSSRGTATAPPRSSPRPVRTAGGRTFGVLAISSNPPLRALNARTCARSRCSRELAALALERSELLEREAGRGARRGCSTARCRRSPPRSTSSAVYRAIVEQAGELSGATKVLLTRYDPRPGRAAPRRRAAASASASCARASRSARG